LSSGAISIDSQDGNLSVSSNPTELKAFVAEYFMSISHPKGDCDLVMSATCKALLLENSKTSPHEVVYLPAIPSEGKRFPLPPVRAELRTELGSALGNRRSRRAFGDLPFSQLTELLYYSARVLEVSLTQHGFPASTRPSPSAGARHPIDLVVVSGSTLRVEVSEQLPSAWKYDPIEHAGLTMSSEEEGHYSNVISSVELNLGSRPAVVLVLAAVPWRTLSRYPSGTAFIFLDAGALLGTLQLVASGMGIAACPVAVSTLNISEFDISLDARTPVVGLALGGLGMSND